MKSAVSDKIELIKAAMEQNLKIAFNYFSQSGERRRMIEPYHLVFQWISDRSVPEYLCDKQWDNTGGIEVTVKFDDSVKWRIIDEFGTDYNIFGIKDAKKI